MNNNNKDDISHIPKDHHLARYDSDGSPSQTTYGHWIFLKILKGQRWEQIFKDADYGGQEVSLAAARKYRDEFLKEHGFSPRTRRRPLEDAYITRHEVTRKFKGTSKHCWVFQIRYGGGQNTKSFSDAIYGDREKSKTAAITYRDKFIREHGIDLAERYSSSEINGVHRTFAADKHGNKQLYYQVSWYEGKSRTKRFSIGKYTEDGARRMAIEFRHQIERQLQQSGSTQFLLPEDKSIKIWRYMDFTKFVYALDKTALFFTQVDKLGDPYEGSYSRANTWMRKLAYAKAKETRTLEDVLKMIRTAREHIFVNCWHINEGESAAMWKLYARTNEAICIQSTFDSLQKCVPNFVNIGMVKYIDYEKDWIPEDSIYHPFLFKRQSFAHEKEIRAIIYGKDERIISPLKHDDTGIAIPIDLQCLIEKVYVSPDAQEWFYELVRDVAQRYGIERDVSKSSLDNEPLK